MRYFLIQPAHRRFVKVLRDRYMSGTPVILNEGDINDLKKLFQQGTMKAVERHKRIYTVVFRAKNRPYSELSKLDHVVEMDREIIDFIEKRFFIAEWKHMRMTIQSSIIVPFLQWLLKRLRNKNRNKRTRED